MHDGLREFAYEDTTFAYAALREDPKGSLIRLADGEAKAQRSFTKSDLMCPWPGCETPDLTTVSRTGGRRDGYKHIRIAKAHEREGWFHILAKAAIVHWAERHPAIAQAEQEVTVGPRVADVLLTGHHGHRIAVEIQYASIPIAAWRERTDSYQALGITPVWLWGHVGHHGPSAMGARLRDVHREVLASGRPLLWINPTLERLAWAADFDGLLPRSDATDAEPKVVALDAAVEITPRGLFPPGWRHAGELSRIRDEEDRRREEAARLEAERRDTWVKEKLDRHREAVLAAEQVKHQATWEYWQERMPMRPGQKCDVCGFEVKPGQARSRRRHEVCDM